MTSSTGELLLSLSYLPAANRLGVVVMKARGLQSDKLKDNIGIHTNTQQRQSNQCEQFQIKIWLFGLSSGIIQNKHISSKTEVKQRASNSIQFI